MKHPEIRQDAEARDKRRKIVRSVAHSSAMEGLPLDQEMLTMLDAYAEGTMTTGEIQTWLVARYRR